MAAEKTAFTTYVYMLISIEMVTTPFSFHILLFLELVTGKLNTDKNK